MWEVRAGRTLRYNAIHLPYFKHEEIEPQKVEMTRAGPYSHFLTARGGGVEEGGQKGPPLPACVTASRGTKK